MPADETQPKGRRASRLARVRRIATWALTAGLLVYVFRSVPLGQTWDAVQAAGPSVIGAAFAYFAYCFVVDSLATWATFRWFCAPLSLKDAFAIRGATYLLAVVNYNLGQGGIVYVVGRRKGVGLARATGTVLLTMGVMLVALLVLAAVGSSLGIASDPRLGLMRIISLSGLGAFVLYLVLIAWRPRWLAERKLLQPLFDAGIVGHFKAWLVRFPHVAGHVLFQWWLLRLFGVEVSFGAAASLLPIIFVIGWVPVTVQGLGTQQIAAMELLGPYALAASVELRHAQVVAFSLSVTTLFSLFGVITGLFFLRWISREIASARSTETEAAAGR